MERSFIYQRMYEEKAQKLQIDMEIEMIFEKLVLEKPDRGSLIAGTGWVRKIRVPNPVAAKGRSGSFRFLYLDLPQWDETYVLTAIHKSQNSNISDSERKVIKFLTDIIKKGVM